MARVKLCYTKATNRASWLIAAAAQLNVSWVLFANSSVAVSVVAQQDACIHTAACDAPTMTQTLHEHAGNAKGSPSQLQ